MTDTDMERAIEQQTIIMEQQAEILRLRYQVYVLEKAYRMTIAAYVRQTQTALAAGLVRWVVTGDRP